MVLKWLIERAFPILYLIDKLTGGSDEKEEGGDEEPVEFQAYARVRDSYAGPFELVYDPVADEVEAPGNVEVEGSEYSPHEVVRWVEAETNVAFELEKDPHDGGYFLDEYSENELKRGGVLPDEGGGSGGSSGDEGGGSGGSSGGGVFSPLSSSSSGSSGSSGIVSKIISVLLWPFKLPFKLLGGRRYLLLALIIPIIGFLALNFLSGTVVGDYAGFAEEQTSDKYLAGEGLFEDQMYMIDQALAKTKCALKGPSCLRQWKLNNTKKPGAKEKGETYKLSIDNFRVGSGSELDIAYKKDGYQIPISFQISNNRQGLKGITARDVRYKVQIIDSDHGRDNPYCETDWRSPEAYDVKDDSDEDRDDLPPGTSAATGFLRLKSINLSNCKMLQPGLGQYRTAYLYVKYDYFSQSTLYVDAMSRKEKNAQNVELTEKESVTADTPVKAVLGADAPAIFEKSRQGSGYAGQPLPIRATLKAGDTGVRYKVNDFELRKSDKTCIMNDDQKCLEDVGGEPMECSFEAGGGENTLKLSESAQKRLINGSDEEGEGADSEGESSQDLERNYWFSKDRKSDIFGCLFGLEDPRSMNPAGESIIMGVAANYTVELEKQLNSLKIMNSRCREVNCPFIYPLEKDNFTAEVIGAEKYYLELGNEDAYWTKKKATCSGPDASDGCTPVEKRLSPVRDSRTVENRKVAVNITKEMVEEFKGAERENFFTCKVYNAVESDKSVVKEFLGDEERFTEAGGFKVINAPAGFRENRLKDIDTKGYAITYSMNRFAGTNAMKGWRVKSRVSEEDRECYESNS